MILLILIIDRYFFFQVRWRNAALWCFSFHFALLTNKTHLKATSGHLYFWLQTFKLSQTFKKRTVIKRFFFSFKMHHRGNREVLCRKTSSTAFWETTKSNNEQAQTHTHYSFFPMFNSLGVTQWKHWTAERQSSTHSHSKVHNTEQHETQT